jgi:hypothetical protein
MNAQLAIQSAGLPDEGERIEFVLDGRDVALDGIYVQRTFRSRWSGYTVERVRSWRPADVNSVAAHRADVGNTEPSDERCGQECAIDNSR